MDDDEFGVVVGGGDADGLAGASREGVGPVEGAGPQLVVVHAVGGQDAQRGGQRVAAAGVVDEPDGAEGGQDPVRGRLGQPDRRGDLRDAEGAATAGEDAQDGGGPLDGLDGAWHP